MKVFADIEDAFSQRQWQIFPPLGRGEGGDDGVPYEDDDDDDDDDEAEKKDGENVCYVRDIEFIVQQLGEKYPIYPIDGARSKTYRVIPANIHGVDTAQIRLRELITECEAEKGPPPGSAPSNRQAEGEVFIRLGKFQAAMARLLLGTDLREARKVLRILNERRNADVEEE